MTAMALTFGAFEAVWRRSHGGGLFHKWWDRFIKPWLHINYRIISITVNSIAVFALGHHWRGLQLWQASILALVVWAFWDISFGMWMGIGRHDYPSQDDRDEYDRQYPVSWILNVLFRDNHDPFIGRYGAVYDFCGMWIRYTYPLVPLLFLGYSPLVLWLGLGIAVCYAIDVWGGWLDAELASGFAAGVCLVIG